MTVGKNVDRFCANKECETDKVKKFNVEVRWLHCYVLV